MGSLSRYTIERGCCKFFIIVFFCILSTAEQAKSGDEANVVFEVGAGICNSLYSTSWTNDFDLDYTDSFYLMLGIASKKRNFFAIRMFASEADAHTDKYPGDWRWSYNEASLDYRYYFMTDRQIRPFMMAGLPLLYSFQLKNGEGNNIEFTDHVFSGNALSANLGAGVDYFPSKKSGFYLGLILYSKYSHFFKGEFKPDNEYYGSDESADLYFFTGVLSLGYIND